MSGLTNSFIITNRRDYFEAISPDLKFLSIDDFLFKVSFVQELGYDSETSDMSPFWGHLWCCQISTETEQFLIDIESVDIRNFKDLLESKLLIVQNATFDLTWLYKESIFPRLIWDTYTSEYVLSMGIKSGIYPRGLDDIVKRYIGVEMSKDPRKEILKKGISDLRSIEYSIDDVKYLHEIKKNQVETLNLRKLMGAALLENNFTRVLSYIEYSGIYLNQDRWYVRTRQLEYEEWGCFMELNRVLDRDYYEEKAKLTKIPEGESFNWSSQPQVLELFQLLGIETFDQKEQKHSIEIDIVRKSDHPIIPTYIKYKQYAKMTSTYGRNFFDYICNDKRIHTKFNPIVDTGRTSCGNTKKGPFPNTQNIEDSKETRGCFEGQGNNVLIVSDYSSQEWVIIADRSQEPALLDFFRSGEADIHSYLARDVYPELKGLSCEEIAANHKEERTATKGAGFAISFGGDGSTIANNLGIPKKRGDEIFKSFMDAFPKLKQYFEKVSKETLQNGYILVNPVTGRKRYISKFRDFYSQYNDREFWDNYKIAKSNENIGPELKAKVKWLMSKKSEIFRLSLNSPIQGTAADISKIAGVLIFDWILENNLINKVKIVNFVHDEYVLETSEKLSEMVVEKVKHYMEKAGSMNLTTLKLKAEPTIVKKWIK